MRVLGAGFVLGIVGVAGVGMASTLRDRGAGAKSDSTPTVVKQEGASTSAVATPASVANAVSTPASAPAASSTRAVMRLRPVLAEGRTSLTDSIYAVRRGDSILVNFDAHGGRTARADKFETMLRNTLPMVYGESAVAAIGTVPTGGLLPTRDVTRVLPLYGMVLTLGDGVKISIRPQTRMTNDGPLVISYVAVVQR